MGLECDGADGSCRSSWSLARLRIHLLADELQEAVYGVVVKVGSLLDSGVSAAALVEGHDARDRLLGKLERANNRGFLLR